ncbi:MAG: FHA domain-containing protein, partial [Sinobacterium sp.]|nr:FHA domain-containing protein [Sinobacterium sp.]
MLKLISKDGTKNVWLVGPTMRIGSARDNEIPLLGTGIAALHGYLHIDIESVVFEPIAGQSSYINEKAVTKKTQITLGDTLRMGSQEFSLSDPRAEKKQAKPIKPSKSADDTQSTIFRQVAVPDASGWMIQGLHPSLKNKRFPIDGTMTLGRSNDCELSFASDRLSRKHAQFKLLDGVLFIKDLDSS